MKKLMYTVLTIMTCGAAYALPVGNPADASLLCDGLFWEGSCGGDACDPCFDWCSAFSFRAGFYGDYVFQRHLRTRGGVADRNRIEHSRINTNAGLLVLNFWDRLDIFSTLGVTHFEMESNAQAFAPIFAADRFEFESDSRFSWSIGGRATLWECGCTALGVEGQYFRTRPNIDRITQNSLLSLYPDNAHLLYHEWQVGLGISHRINMFVPYVAVKWARARANIEGVGDDFTTTFGSPLESTNFRSHKHWGWALGVSLVDCEKASVAVEGRWGDEKAVHVNGQIRF